VNYVNFFSPDTYSASAAAADQSDPAYWEENCPKLCPTGGSNVYNGYKFLFLESAVNVETAPKVPSSVGTMNWTSIARKTAKIAADVLVKNVVYQAASVGLVSECVSSLSEYNWLFYSRRIGGCLQCRIVVSLTKLNK